MQADKKNRSVRINCQKKNGGALEITSTVPLKILKNKDDHLKDDIELD